MKDVQPDERADAPLGILRVGKITLLVEGYAAQINGQHVSLTLGEYRLLFNLLRHAGRTVSMDELARLDGDMADPPTNRALRARVAAIRRKMGPGAAQIKNVRGVGYLIVDR